MSEYPLPEDTVALAFKDATGDIRKELSKKIVRDTIAEVKKLYAPEIKRRTNEWVKENKELILDKYVAEAKKDFIAKFEQLIEEDKYYD